MDAPQEIIFTVSFSIANTTSPCQSKTDSSFLRYDFKPAQFKSIPSLIFLLFPIGYLFRSHYSLIKSTVKNLNTIFLLAHLHNAVAALPLFPVTPSHSLCHLSLYLSSVPVSCCTNLFLMPVISFLFTELLHFLLGGPRWRSG
jgi:hypothetical protein